LLYNLVKTGKPEKFIKKIVHSRQNPVFPGDPSLPENPHKEIHAYLGSMGIWNGKNKFATDHIRMFPSMERTVKTKGFQPPDKIRP
jgi:hypothetical protein